MSSAVKLEDAEIERRLKTEIPGWQYRQGRLHREYRFADFVHACKVMAAAAKAAEQIGHHPDWRNLYSWVNVDLSTHLVCGVSDLDFQLAAARNAAAAEQGGE